MNYFTTTVTTIEIRVEEEQIHNILHRWLTTGFVDETVTED
jgi:hypothetical protein